MSNNPLDAIDARIAELAAELDRLHKARALLAGTEAKPTHKKSKAEKKSPKVVQNAELLRGILGEKSVTEDEAVEMAKGKLSTHAVKTALRNEVYFVASRDKERKGKRGASPLVFKGK